MKIQKDIFGIEPSIGDIIIFNPKCYKGTAYGTCIRFNEKGKPVLKDIKTQFKWANSSINGEYTTITSFVVKK